MSLGVNIEPKSNPKSLNFGDISGPLPRGGQMGGQGLQNGTKTVPKGSQGGATWTPWAPHARLETPQARPKTGHVARTTPERLNSAKILGNPSEC